MGGGTYGHDSHIATDVKAWATKLAMPWKRPPIDLSETETRMAHEQKVFEVKTNEVHEAIVKYGGGVGSVGDGNNMNVNKTTDTITNSGMFLSAVQAARRRNIHYFIKGGFALHRYIAPNEKWKMDIDVATTGQTRAEFYTNTRRICNALGGQYQAVQYLVMRDRIGGNTSSTGLNTMPDKAGCKLVRKIVGSDPIPEQISFHRIKGSIEQHLSYDIAPAALAYRVDDPTRWLMPFGLSDQLRSRVISSSDNIPPEVQAKYAKRGFTFIHSSKQQNSNSNNIEHITMP